MSIKQLAEKFANVLSEKEKLETENKERAKRRRPRSELEELLYSDMMAKQKEKEEKAKAIHDFLVERGLKRSGK
jgi:hypothetical protein